MTAYYNDNDKKVCVWLRELIKRDLIAAGDVDDRPIQEIQPNDIKQYIQCHFFAGIGGWSYALRLAGWHDNRPVWTGSCPCQPYSTAGKQKGNADERNLWPEFYRLIRESKPDVCFGEQVASAIGHGWLDGISTDLEAEGYAVGHCVLGAHSVGSPHKRQRLYWVADSKRTKQQGEKSQEGRFALYSLNSLANAEPGGRIGTAPAIWQDFRIIECSDGKSRRIPIENEIKSIFQWVAHGIPGRMVSVWDSFTTKIEERIVKYAKEKKIGTREVLREMRNQIGAEILRGLLGRYDSLQKEKILFAALLQLERKLGEFNDRIASNFCEIQKEVMRKMRYNSIRHEITPCSPQEHDSIRQQERELRDSLCILSQDNALESIENILKSLTNFPLSEFIPARVVRLRGYGNAIVPQVAAEFIKAFCEVSP